MLLLLAGDEDFVSPELSTAYPEAPADDSEHAKDNDDNHDSAFGLNEAESSMKHYSLEVRARVHACSCHLSVSCGCVVLSHIVLHRKPLNQCVCACLCACVCVCACMCVCVCVCVCACACVCVRVRVRNCCASRRCLFA